MTLTAEQIARIIDPSWDADYSATWCECVDCKEQKLVAKTNALEKAHAILALLPSHDARKAALEEAATDYRWLIEAPGLRYLGTRTLGGVVSFHWTEDPNAALAFCSEEQADAAMLAVRTLNEQAFGGHSLGMFGFETSLGNAKAVEHGFIRALKSQSPAPSVSGDVSETAWGVARNITKEWVEACELKERLTLAEKATLSVIAQLNVYGALSRAGLLQARDGWKLVPLRPTKEMIDAAEDAPSNMYGIGVLRCVVNYRAMLAAAPLPDE